MTGSELVALATRTGVRADRPDAAVRPSSSSPRELWPLAILGARIIHVADALDSMRTTRMYRAARPLDEALEELRAGAGTQFCPRCVSVIERIIEQEGVAGHTARMPLVSARAS